RSPSLPRSPQSRPQKRTLRSATGMSAFAKSGHETLFDYLIGGDQQLRMKLQAERFSRLEVDHELKLDGLNHWEIAWLFALEDSPSIEAGLMKGLGDARAITH